MELITENNFFLNLYPVSPIQCWVVPAKRPREWMKHNPHSYRCAPLANCNSFGWDVLLPEPVDVTWNGGTNIQDLQVHQGAGLAISSFGHGTLTFEVGYTWHTPPGWSLMFMPLPNFDHGPIAPMSAIVETDKLKYPIFSSVTLKAPGDYSFPQFTPICRVIPINLSPVVECEPELKAEPADFREYRQWQRAERDKIKGSAEYRQVKEDRPFKSEKLGWGKFYHQLAEYPRVQMKPLRESFKADLSKT